MRTINLIIVKKDGTQIIVQNIKNADEAVQLMETRYGKDASIREAHAIMSDENGVEVLTMLSKAAVAESMLRKFDSIRDLLSKSLGVPKDNIQEVKLPEGSDLSNVTPIGSRVKH